MFVFLKSLQHFWDVTAIAYMANYQKINQLYRQNKRKKTRKKEGLLIDNLEFAENLRLSNKLEIEISTEVYRSIIRD